MHIPIESAENTCLACLHFAFCYFLKHFCQALPALQHEGTSTNITWIPCEKKHCSPPLPCDDKYLPPPDLRLPTFPLAKQALRFSSLLLCFAGSVGEKFLLWLFAETLRTHEKQYRELGTAESILPSSQGLVAEV